MNNIKRVAYKGSGMARRRFLQGAMALSGLLTTSLPMQVLAASNLHSKSIPSSGENIPILGMGSWITFDAHTKVERDQRCNVLRTFFDLGGKLVDSSPMYGMSEDTIGYCLEVLGDTHRVFSASKVWTPGQRLGISQMLHSANLWGAKTFDLMQIHNLLDWEVHLQTLKRWKAEGRIRYLGITTSHGRRHQDVRHIMETEPLDFVQLTYNLVDREAERILLPLALERGIAVIVNRPFRGGSLFNRVQSKPLPAIANELGCRNWAQVFLKFVISHPAVTCAIPATSQVQHMQENMEAGRGSMPAGSVRQQLLDGAVRLL